MADQRIQPFRLAIPQAALDDLSDRLARTRWPDELPDAAWRYGVPLGYLKELAEYWRTTYDWRRHEARLNEFPQFTTTLDGARVHFIHARSPEPGALPLVITHGWPGSIAEFLAITGPLADPRTHGGDPADAFHVVAPSIPGFGLSGPTREPGWDVHRIALAWIQLMNRLGYDRYGAQGGDWGSRISWEMGRISPAQVIGVHVNMLVAVSDPVPDAALTRQDRARLERLARFRSELSGYMHIQSTRPQTLAYGLTDSPVGQLAWIVEKFKDWTGAPSVPEDAVDRDQMLTDVMLYWLTGTAGSSARLYYEFSRSHDWGPPEPSPAPTGVAVFAHDIAQPVRQFAEPGNNIVHWSEFDQGGHFAAMEQPELLIADIREFFRRFR
jgi:microsomal epoxide hydrolase